jgi:hypothetical protein
MWTLSLVGTLLQIRLPFCSKHWLSEFSTIRYDNIELPFLRTDGQFNEASQQTKTLLT